MASHPTIFVLDDDADFRQTLLKAIATLDVNVTFSSSAEDFLASYDASRPACLVLESRLQQTSSLELQEEIQKKGFRLPLIFVSSRASLREAVTAIKRGALDFLEKPVRWDQLREAIRHAIELETKRHQLDSDRIAIEPLLARLTAAERDVCDQIIAGKTSKAIASEIGLSLRTIQSRRSNLMKKLNVKNRSDLLELVFSFIGQSDFFS